MSNHLELIFNRMSDAQQQCSNMWAPLQKGSSCLNLVSEIFAFFIMLDRKINLRFEFVYCLFHIPNDLNEEYNEYILLSGRYCVQIWLSGTCND